MWGSMNNNLMEKNFLAGRELHKEEASFSHKLVTRKSILLIEDDLDFAEVMSELLEDYVDLKVDIAADSYEAMTKLSEKVYDYIVLDWYLQEMTGKKTIEKVESLFKIDPAFPAKWKTKTVPVIVLSAQSFDKIQPFSGPHFKYRSFISKRQSLRDILDQLKEEVENPYIEENCG